jgi:hypothetical protein
MKKDKTSFAQGFEDGERAILHNPELTPEAIRRSCQNSIDHLPDGGVLDLEEQKAYLEGRIAGAQSAAK